MIDAVLAGQGGPDEVVEARGLAVVSVRGGTCQGCNMNIPPQLYNVLQRGLSIETCPSCHRLIYWEELMKAESSPP